MKQSNNHSSSPLTGRHYWRSMDELADTPEFKDWLHREFPQGASELEESQSRRSFLKLMSASFALAGVATLGSGCRKPEEHLEPYGKQPENYTYGEAQYFATAMPTRTGAVPLVVKSYEGRPVKIEGNGLFPGSNGGTDRYAQASILDLYDVDRAKTYTHGGKDKAVSRDEAVNALKALSERFSANQGEGLAFLAETSTSPSRARLQKIIAQKFPKSKWYAHDAIDSGIHQRAATKAFGQPVRPVFHFGKARVILSLDCDFIGGEDDTHNHIRKFAAGRKAGGGMSRLYAVESLFTLTGANADHRLRLPAGQVIEIASQVLGLIMGGANSSPWPSECAADLIANRGNVLVVAGQRQPLEVHLLAHAINTALDSIGNTVSLIPAMESVGEDLSGLEASTVDTLVILGGNPAYNSNWTAKPKTVVRLGYYADETAEIADWNFPATHYLETWGDAITSDGIVVPVQPLIQPLFGGMMELEFLALIAGEAQTAAHDIVRATFGGADEDWKRFLFNGYTGVASDSLTGVKMVQSSNDLNQLIAGVKSATASASSLEVVFYRDAKMDDGRYANNGWMQELPDPITKMTWDNAVHVSRRTAKELGMQNGDLVEVSLNGRTVVGPIWVQPGMADYSLGLALGYGREKAGRVGTGVGFNAYKIFHGKYVEAGATIRKTGGTHILACTQHHWSMEGRPAVREFNVDELEAASKPKNGEEQADEQESLAEERFHGVEPPIVQSLYRNPLDDAKATALHQWGMAIDLNACVGCGTCVVACQSENNIPIVGKDQVLRGREMHWMRIDRYFTADPRRKHNRSRFDPSADMNQTDENQQFEDWIDEVQAVNQPMLCQQCETAPCENVCPVAATVHDQEGLNTMAYNRCIGTRYCSNNCPYKVRRFNFLDFNKRPLSELVGTSYSTTLNHKTAGEWDLFRWLKDPNAGMRTEDEWDLIKLSKNPDVTVRMRGVMEKCTYCTQRIEHAKIAQKVKAGASDNVRLSDAAGTIPKTACQQACPAGAIVFGDISDDASKVSAQKRSTLNYSVLGDLLTKPRTTYLARVRNPNPKMPEIDKAHPRPFSTQEYENSLLTPQKI